MTQTIQCPRCKERTLSVTDDGEALLASCPCGYSDAAYYGVAV